MARNGEHPDIERARLVVLTQELIERNGEGVTRGALAAAAGLPRARVEALFPAEADLFDAVVAQWFEQHIAIMEDVLASDLPPNRKMYEFFARRFLLHRARFRADPAAYTIYCELGSNNFEQVRSYVDLADHYLCELIAQAQADGAFPGLAIDEALSLINQMVLPYTMGEMLTYMDERLSEAKLARIVDTLFAGLSGESRGAAPVAGLRIA